MLRQWSIPITVLQATVEYYSHESCSRVLVLQCPYYTSTPLFHNSTKPFLLNYYWRTPVRCPSITAAGYSYNSDTVPLLNTVLGYDTHCQT
eukprot:4581994-Pyramimonas_sp.AAC.3